MTIYVLNKNATESLTKRDKEFTSAVFEIEGKPVPYAMARQTSTNWYDPRGKLKALTKWAIKAQWPWEPLTIPVEVGLVFYMPLPAKWPIYKREKAIAGEVLHTSKPDLDNLIKLYLDCLKKIVIDDDNQVVRFNPPAEKRYSYDPRTIITVSKYCG